MENQNSMLRSARIKKSWTPQFVSEQVGVSRNTYTRWEAGIQVPRLSSLDALCKVFAMTPAELGFAQTVYQGRTAKQEIYPVREDALADELIGMEAQDLTQALEMWTIGIAACWQWYMDGEQAELERLVPAYLVRLRTPTLHAGPEQKIAARLTALAYQLQAMLDLQRCDFVSAQSNGTQALVYSQLAQDWNVYVAAQIRLAMIYAARKRIGAALIAYNEALRRINVHGSRISPILHSWVFARLAEIQAAMGRDTEALQFLKLAMAVFPAKPEEDECISYTHCDRSMLYLYQGLVFLRLGQPLLAWDALAQVDGLQPAPGARVRADFLRYRAYTSLILGNMVQSCVYLEAAAKATQAIHSDLMSGEVYTLYEHMLAIWGQEPRVRALARLFQK
jgi:transcriptional regulator with XRE-family HTH domain